MLTLHEYREQSHIWKTNWHIKSENFNGVVIAFIMLFHSYVAVEHQQLINNKHICLLEILSKVVVDRWVIIFEHISIVSGIVIDWCSISVSRIKCCLSKTNTMDKNLFDVFWLIFLYTKIDSWLPRIINKTCHCVCEVNEIIALYIFYYSNNVVRYFVNRERIGDILSAPL